MKLGLKDYEVGVRKYWAVVESRSLCIRDIENIFPQFASIYASRTPPHFLRSDLEKNNRMETQYGRSETHHRFGGTQKVS